MKTTKYKLCQSGDKTLADRSIKQMIKLCEEYDLIKAKRHTRYKFVTDFYNTHHLKRQNFLKFYHRYQQTGAPNSLLPSKRGPRYQSRRTIDFIEDQVLELRRKGLNRYEIYMDLQDKLQDKTPKPSTIYQITKRHNMNTLKPLMREEKRKIITQRIGELGHIDCHYLPKNVIEDCDKRYYLVGLIDHKSSVAWCEVIDDLSSLNVMFAVMKMLNFFAREFDIRFEAILTDNGSEFGGNVKDTGSNKLTNPYCRLLHEMGIKQRYTRPYRPQTNGKIERFWKTIEYDLFEDVVFDSLEHLQNEVFQYMTYYNYARPHMSAHGKTPSHLINKNIS